MKKLLFCMTTLFLLFSCEKKEIRNDNDDISSEQQQIDYKTRIKSLGFTGDNLIEFNEYFVVENDIVIYKKDLNTCNLKQASTGSLVSNEIAPNIRVLIDGSLADWTNIIADALETWNSVESNVHFTIVTSSPHITIYADTDPDCPEAHRNLGFYVCAMATFPTIGGQPGATISLNINSTFMTSAAQRMTVITHEFGHCIGFRHTNWQAENEPWAETIEYTPSSDEESLMNGGECGLVKTLSTFDRTALCQLYRNWEVCSGRSNDLDLYRSLYGYCLTVGKNPEDVVGIAIAKLTDHCYVWYNDGTVTSGKSYCLDAYLESYNYSLAPGKTPNDIVGMGINSDDRCYVWYDDGTRSVGSSSDLDAYGVSNYTMAIGKSPNDVVGMAISSIDHCYVWYNDGTVSAGKSYDLDYFKAPYSYSLAPGKSPNDIVEMGIDSNDNCYVWFRN